MFVLMVSMLYLQKYKLSLQKNSFLHFCVLCGLQGQFFSKRSDLLWYFFVKPEKSQNLTVGTFFTFFHCSNNITFWHKYTKIILLLNSLNKYMHINKIKIFIPVNKTNVDERNISEKLVNIPLKKQLRHFDRL